MKSWVSNFGEKMFKGESLKNTRIESSLGVKILMDENFSKLAEEAYPDPRSSENSKQVELKETHDNTHYN